jgi:glycosyltransferase involved in cell wall biosynthesis/tetratricopeptide (TPR) repeat protein
MPSLIPMAAHRPFAAPGQTSPRWQVVWEGDAFQHHSLSIVNRALCSRLLQTGVDLAVRAPDMDCADQDDPCSQLLARAGLVPTRAPTITVRHSWPPRFVPRPTGRWVHIQPWEFGGIPDSWIRALKPTDEVWAYSSWVKENYTDSGLPADKVHIVPCGVDTNVFQPQGDRYMFKHPRSFRLLFVGGFIPRKGIDVLLKAYANAFGRRDDVSLVLKGFGAQGVYANGMHEAVRSVSAANDGAVIELIEDDLTQAQMATLYRSCDVLVHPYRGEGFAMPVAEAMASGLPVVVTGDGATRDFCDESNAWLLPSRRVPLAGMRDVGPSSRGYWFAEPDLDHLTELLRELPQRQEASKMKAATARERIVTGYDWDKVASGVKARLENLAADGKTPKSQPSRKSARQARSRVTKPSLPIFEDNRLIGACLIVKDEEKTLPGCLASIRGLVDEIVVYDTGSTDGTVELARRAGARVVEGYWDDDFGRARNAALEHCRGQWVLWIDADERFICDDAKSLRATLDQLGRIGHLDALLVDIYNLMGDGSALANVHRAFRIFRKATCVWYGSLHEQVDLRPELNTDGRVVQAAPLLGARFDHLGYMETFVRERDKLARNLHLAKAELARPAKPGQEGIAEFNLARALAAIERPEEAEGHFEVALGMVKRGGVQERAVLLHIIQNLVTLKRYEEVVSYVRLLENVSHKNDISHYFEGVALRRLGKSEEAITLFEKVGALTNEDGFAFPNSMLQSELAGALVDTGRADEAAEQLVLLIRQTPDVLAMTIALKVFASTGRPPEDLAIAMGVDHLDKVGAALVLVPPAAAGPVAEALYRCFGARPQLLAAATRFAPALPTLQALEWSSRLRAIGMDDACPLIAQARMDGLNPLERVRAAITAHAAFADTRGRELALALAPGLNEIDLGGALAEVNALDPALTVGFALAAAGAGAPGAGPVGTPQARRRAVANALEDLGYAELSAQIQDAPASPAMSSVGSW